MLGNVPGEGANDIRGSAGRLQKERNCTGIIVDTGSAAVKIPKLESPRLGTPTLHLPLLPKPPNIQYVTVVLHASSRAQRRGKRRSHSPSLPFGPARDVARAHAPSPAPFSRFSPIALPPPRDARAEVRSAEAGFVIGLVWLPAWLFGPGRSFLRWVFFRRPFPDWACEGQPLRLSRSHFSLVFSVLLGFYLMTPNVWYSSR